MNYSSTIGLPRILSAVIVSPWMLKNKAGPSALGSKEVPVGKDNCLAVSRLFVAFSCIYYRDILTINPNISFLCRVGLLCLLEN